MVKFNKIIDINMSYFSDNHWCFKLTMPSLGMIDFSIVNVQLFVYLIKIAHVMFSLGITALRMIREETLGFEKA